MNDDIAERISEVVKDLFNIVLQPEVTRPEPQFGDAASNVAMQLTKELKQPPREIAEHIAAALREHDDITEVSIAGPGFINIRLKDAYVGRALDAALPKVFAGKTIVTEYSDPNPFKVLHAGHLYTTVVGDVISRLFETAGGEVHRINYGGDVGRHVGIAMWAVIKRLGGELPEKLSDVPEAERAIWLSARYVEGNTAYEDDEDSKAEIVAVNKKVYQLHADGEHDSPFAQIYWTCREWSYDGFRRLYDQLAIAPFEAFIPESEVTPTGIKIVEKGLQEGVFEKSEGAVIFRGEPHGLHTRVFINSNGLPLYEAKDLGLAATKWQRYQFDKSVIITANDIVEYMKVVVKALSHFHPEAAERGSHLTHGMIKLPGSIKMSSRKGNILLGQDVLNAAAEANRQLMGNDDSDVVLGAVKYAFLKQRIGGDIIYDPKESVSLEGNSGPYLQYAHARARSILAKTNHTTKTYIVGTVLTVGENMVFDGFERELALKLAEYPEIITRATGELMPHHVCTYLYELAQTFNRFYEHSRVLGDPREALRLQLVLRYADTLRDGLRLLGIPSPERL